VLSEARHVPLKVTAQADAIVRMADGEFTSEEERDAFQAGLTYAGGKTVRRYGEAARQARRELKCRRSCEKLLHDHWLGTVWLSDTYRCGTGHRATRPRQGRIEVGVSGLDWPSM